MQRLTASFGDADLDGCLSIGLPGVENIVLLGWPGDLQQMFISHSSSIESILDRDKELHDEVSFPFMIEDFELPKPCCGMDSESKTRETCLRLFFAMHAWNLLHE